MSEQFVIDEKLQEGASRRLNCGGGYHPLLYYVNLDSDPNAPADIHATVPPIPYDDESLDEIYAGHLLEHLSFEDAKTFLAECLRCLVPGGKVGIVVPDTREVLRRYLAGAIDCVEWPHRVYWPVADLDAVCALFLYSTIQDSPHRWSYDEQTLARIMRQAGFARLVPIDRYNDPRLGEGDWYQMGWDGYKNE